MIALIEPVCINWEHENVNAGLLRLVSTVSEEPVVYFGEAGQIKAVSALYHSPGVKFIEIKHIPPRELQDVGKSIGNYLRMIETVILKIKPRVVMITAAYRPCITAVKILAKLNKNIEFKIVLHGMIEEKAGHQKEYDKIICQNIANVTYLSYSSYCRERYKRMGGVNIDFIHLSYISHGSETRKKQINGSEIKIGVIGACANKNAMRFVRAVSKDRELSDKVKFYILSGNADEFQNRNCVIVSKNFKRKDMEKLMCDMDFLLVPYGRNEYKVSTSGVIWDGISNRVPLLMYDSPCLKYYHARVNLGYLCGSLEELKTILKQISFNGIPDNEFFVNLDMLEKENMETMERLLR